MDFKMTVSYKKGVPVDWTNGLGVIPAGGSITIPASASRKAIFIQNQDTSTLTIQYSAQKASDGSATTITLLLEPGSATGSQGGADERNTFFVCGTIVVSGTAGKQCAVSTIE